MTEGENRNNPENRSQTLDVTEQYLNMSDSDFRDYVSQQEQPLILKLDFVDSYPPNKIKNFLLNSNNKVFIRATKEDQELYGKDYPGGGITWEIVE